MAGILELAHLVQQDRVAKVQVGRGRIETGLDPQRAPERELFLELGSHQDLGSAAAQFIDLIHKVY